MVENQKLIMGIVTRSAEESHTLREQGTARLGSSLCRYIRILSRITLTAHDLTPIQITALET